MRLMLLLFPLLFSLSLEAEPFPPMDAIYHPITTTSRLAQGSFDRGLTFLFAYNHDSALHEFENAAKADPQCAMAYWGMAMALGQNVNTDVTPENELRCYNFIQKAKSLAQKVTPPEQAYIDALLVRYTNIPGADLVPLRSTY